MGPLGVFQGQAKYDEISLYGYNLAQGSNVNKPNDAPWLLYE